MRTVLSWSDLMWLMMILFQMSACTGSSPDYVVEKATTGTPARCLAARVYSVQHTGISSPSMNNVNTRALARSVDGKVVQWDYMRSLRKDVQLGVDDQIFLLLGATGQPVGITTTCPEGLASEG